MSIDTQLLADHVAAITSDLHERFGTDAEICTVGIVVEVDTNAEGEHDFLTTCSDRRLWVECAFWKEAMHQTEDRIEAHHTEDD